MAIKKSNFSWRVNDCPRALGNCSGYRLCQRTKAQPRAPGTVSRPELPLQKSCPMGSSRANTTRLRAILVPHADLKQDSEQLLSSGE